MSGPLPHIPEPISEAPKDIIDRLKFLADMKRGDMPPQWMHVDGCWAKGISEMAADAWMEIKYLRMDASDWKEEAMRCHDQLKEARALAERYAKFRPAGN